MTLPYFCLRKWGHAACAHWLIFSSHPYICARIRHLVRSLDVYFDDQIPVVIAHILECNISEDTRIVEKNIYPPKCLDRSLDDSLAVLDAVVVRDSVAARSFNLLDDNICSLCRASVRTLRYSTPFLRTEADIPWRIGLRPWRTLRDH